MGCVHYEVERMDLRPPRRYVLLRLRHNPPNAVILPSRVLVYSGATWIQEEAGRFGDRNSVGPRVQLQSKADYRRSPSCKPVSRRFYLKGVSAEWNAI